MGYGTGAVRDGLTVASRCLRSQRCRERAHHLVDGRSAGGWIGADVGFAAGPQRDIVADAHRRMGLIEAVIGIGILDIADFGVALGEVATRLRRRPVVGGPHEDAERNGWSPVSFSR